MFDLTFKNNTIEKRWKKDFFKEIFDYSEKILKLSKNVYGISVNLVGERKIRTLNKKYRGKDKATDVLSFPLNNKPLGKKSSIYVTMELGDIFICLPFAKKNAKESNWNIKLELRLLAVHGFLHLLGFGHEKSEKKRYKMFLMQDKILNKFINKK